MILVASTAIAALAMAALLAAVPGVRSEGEGGVWVEAALGVLTSEALPTDASDLDHRVDGDPDGPLAFTDPPLDVSPSDTTSSSVEESTVDTWSANTPTTSTVVASSSTTSPASTDPTPTSDATTSTSSAPTTDTAPSPTMPTTVSTTPTTGSTIDDHHQGSNDGLESLRNTNPLFDRYSSVPSSALDLQALTEPTATPDNGTVGDGQFRMACQYSHFAYDDPIVFPGQPGASHLHMFFGNTLANANSTAATLFDSGGGSCNGFELNRSAYWTPALLDGKGNAVVPEQIILYYKTKFPAEARPLPVGLKMISGSTGSSFTVSDVLHWSCGGSGQAYNKSNHIPDCGGDIINAAIAFPECWDGRNLDSADHRSHLHFVDAALPCPPSHPVRLPQISILLYYPGQPSVAGWHLSSDGQGGHGGGGPPGGSLHADWFGGWNDDALNLWIDGCITRARNCSYGQTGTDRRFAPLNGLQNYPGPYVLPLPD